MLGWVVGGVGTFVVSLIFSCMFLQMRCRGVGPPFGPHARPWAIFIAVATALVSAGFGLLILAASHETSAALAGLVVPGGLSHLYDAMGKDMQAWGDVRCGAAAEEPPWISAAAKYYYDQVKGRIK